MCLSSIELSKAQKCLQADDPYAEAVKNQEYKGWPSPFVKRFHFADNSYLDFQVTYTPVDAGRVMPEGGV